jgi:hypothetical protein
MAIDFFGAIGYFEVQSLKLGFSKVKGLHFEVIRFNFKDISLGFLGFTFRV